MSRISRTSQALQAEAVRPIQRIFHASQSPQAPQARQAEAIRLSRRIGVGAEGEVYEILDRNDLVAKIYHEPPPPEKAEKLIALSHLGNDRLFKLSAWPVDVLRDKPDGDVFGFVMKKISLAEEVHALHSPKSRLQKFPEASWAFLIYVAANIARAVAAIHEHGFVIGDVNPKNILVTRKATVYLLDCDSFQVSAGGKTYRCEGGFPEYTPPELQGMPLREVDRHQEHDRFGLAVAIFQLLFLGRHPFSGTFLGAGEMPLERAIGEARFAYGVDAEARRMRQPPGTLALDSMPTPLVDLFRRAFLSSDRPEPREWTEPLDALAKSLKKCGLHNGHYYYQELRDCPWCGIESHVRVRLFNFMLAGSNVDRGHFRLDEIWKEIVSVEAPVPAAALMRLDKSAKALKPSAEVAAVANEKRNRLLLSIGFSVVAGLLIGLFVKFPFAFWLIALAGIIAHSLAKTEQTLTEMLLQRRQVVLSDPLVGNIRALKQEAEKSVRKIEERWEKEAGNERFLAKLNELRDRTDTYVNLPKVREQKLKQLEMATREDKFCKFLDQFDIDRAEIKGFSSGIKTYFLSYGIETAADVTEQNLSQIPAMRKSRATKLLEWRRDLERRFVFDPVKGVSPQARINAEKEIDQIRFRLEHELSNGTFYLRRIKQEIEESRKRLQPALANARQSLAQADKDLEVAKKHNSFKLILALLLIAFFTGVFLGRWLQVFPDRRPRTVPVEYQPQPPPVASNGDNRGGSLKASNESQELYLQGLELSRQERFAEASSVFQRAIEIDPLFNAAYEQLGYVLYRQGSYEESIKASNKAIELDNNNSFGPHYNLGIVYVAQQNWKDAKRAFQYALARRRKDFWADSYSHAYYYLGLSTARLGEAETTIEALEKSLKAYPGFTVERFELATLYLWVGKRKAARTQYEILMGKDKTLAEELRKLMENHRIRKPVLNSAANSNRLNRV